MARKKSAKRSWQDGGEPTVESQADALFDERWEEVEAKTFDPPEDGTYEARVSKCSLGNAKSSGRFQFSWDFVIITGPEVGKHAFKYDGLDTDDGVGYFKGDLIKLGIDHPTSKDELIQLAEDLSDQDNPTYLVIKLRSSKRRDSETGEMTTSQFVRIVKALEPDEVTDETLGEEAEGEVPSDAGDEELDFDSLEEGTTITADFGGTEYSGTVTKVNAKKETATADFEDGTTETVSFDNITSIEVEEPEGGGDEEGDGSDEITLDDLEKGTKIKALCDGDEWDATVVSVNTKKETIKVEYSDGEESTITLEDIVSLEEEGDEDTSDVPEVEVRMKRVTPVQKKAIGKMAQAANLDITDYENPLECLIDVAKNTGIGGTFANADKLIAAIKKAQ